MSIQQRTRAPYDSMDPVALYDATRETRNRLVGAIVALFPVEDALERMREVDADFAAVDSFNVEELKAARQRYRDQVDDLLAREDAGLLS